MHFTLNCSRKIGCFYTNTSLQASSPSSLSGSHEVSLLVPSYPDQWTKYKSLHAHCLSSLESRISEISYSSSSSEVVKAEYNLEQSLECSVKHRNIEDRVYSMHSSWKSESPGWRFYLIDDIIRSKIFLGEFL